MIERLLEKKLGGFSAKSILDVGPGYSNFSRIAARITGAQFIAFLDCDEAVLAWQTEECKKASLSVSSLVVSLDTADPFQLEGNYDLILCQEVLEHLPKAEGVFAALVRLLSPDGRIVVTVPTMRSERWLKWLNPDYMKCGVGAHVREFDEQSLRRMVQQAGLIPLEFIPTQPHYFVYHTWLFGSRMRVEPSTGRILTTKGFRHWVGIRLFRLSRWLFMRTGFEFWGRLLPRNYFVVARRCEHICPA